MLQVRRVRFDFEDDVAFVWNPQNPAFSVYMNATSIIAIAFEKFIVAAVREAMERITDAEAAAEAEAFLRQEAQHATAHRQHLRALIKRYPGLQQTLDEAIARYDQLGQSKPLRFRLAYIADLEATFTPFFKLLLDNEARFFRPGDDRVASLFLWHFVEEVEHRSSALIVYNAVVGSNTYRVRALPGVVKHLVGVWKVIADGFDTHVQRADRQIDARLLRPVAGALQALRRKLPFAAAPVADGVQRCCTASAARHLQTGHRESDPASRSCRPAATGVRRAMVRPLRARRGRLPLVLEQSRRLSAGCAKLTGRQRFPWLASAPRRSTRSPSPWAASRVVTHRR